MNISKEKLIIVLTAHGFPPAGAKAKAERLLSVGEPLAINVYEMSEGLPLSTVTVNGKYSVADVLGLRSDSDIPDAILDLETYRKDPSKEYILFRRKM